METFTEAGNQDMKTQGRYWDDTVRVMLNLKLW